MADSGVKGLDWQQAGMHRRRWGVESNGPGNAENERSMSKSEIRFYLQDMVVVIHGSFYGYYFYLLTNNLKGIGFVFFLPQEMNAPSIF